MDENQTKKILRVGVIQEGKILEERLIRKHGDVSIGFGIDNTIRLPLPRIPKSFKLFEAKKKSYNLCFTKNMAGKVAITEEIYELTSMIDAGMTEKRKDCYALKLNEQSRGKLVFGEASILFQFVTPPPPIPKLQLPAQAKGSWLRNLDMPFIICFIALLIFEGGTVGALEYWWLTTGMYEEQTLNRDSVDLYELLGKEVEVVQKVEKDDKKGKGEQQENAAQNTASSEDSGKKDTKKAAPEKAKGPEDKEVRYKRALQNVQNNTILRFIGAKGAGGEKVAGVSVDDETMAAKLGDAWSSSGNVKVATSGDVGYAGGPRSTGGGGTYKKLDDKDMGGGIKTGKVDAGAAKGDEMMIKIKVGGDLGGKTGTGTIDQARVADVFNRRVSAIKYCYDKALKINQNLEGKVTVKFTIGPAGRITEISIVQNETGDSALGACIISKIQSWKFDPPEGGSVTFVRPFIFTKG